MKKSIFKVNVQLEFNEDFIFANDEPIDINYIMLMLREMDLYSKSIITVSDIRIHPEKFEDCLDVQPCDLKRNTMKYTVKDFLKESKCGY